MSDEGRNQEIKNGKKYSKEDVLKSYFEYKNLNDFDEKSYLECLVDYSYEIITKYINEYIEESKSYFQEVEGKELAETKLIVYLGNIELFLKQKNKGKEFWEFCIKQKEKQLKELMMRLPYIWLLTSDKFLNYASVRLIYQFIVVNVGLSGNEYHCQPILYNVFYAMRGEIRPDVIIDKERAKIDVNKTNINSTIKNGLSLYHLILKYFRKNRHQQLVYSDPKYGYGQLLRNLHLKLNCNSLIQVFEDLLVKFPDLEYYFLMFSIDLNKKTPFLSDESGSHIKNFSKKMVDRDVWDIRYINRKRLELCDILVHSTLVKFSVWELVLTCLTRYVSRVTEVMDTEKWLKYNEEATCGFITIKSQELDKDELFDYENTRMAILTGATGIRVYLHHQLDERTKSSPELRDQIHKLGEYITKVINIKNDPTVFSIEKEFNSLFFLFLVSEPSLYTLLVILIHIDENIKKIFNSPEYQIENERELVTKLNELCKPDYLILRYFQHNKFDHQTLVQLFTENNKEGVVFFKLLVKRLSDETNWSDFIKCVNAINTELYYELGICLMETTYELKKLKSKNSNKDAYSSWDGLDETIRLLEILNYKFLANEALFNPNRQNTSSNTNLSQIRGPNSQVNANGNHRGLRNS
ncbi:hypothetical protein K502DRAFT_363827 [Neoconidiobolus thromboides FSU 785]|nr:hypothetical protein K502DRAFT_363827 [Neoconidiobolus thromboides FSU 785]